MAELEFNFHMKSAVSNLEKARLWAANIARRLGFDERAVFEVEISVYEACANVVEHAYANNPEHYIDIKITVEMDKLTVTILDEGGAFEPPPLREKDINAIINTQQEGGLGLYIIEACMDEILYRRQGGRNILELIKYLPPAPAAR